MTRKPMEAHGFCSRLHQAPMKTYGDFRKMLCNPLSDTMVSNNHEIAAVLQVVAIVVAIIAIVVEMPLVIIGTRCGCYSPPVGPTSPNGHALRTILRKLPYELTIRIAPSIIVLGGLNLGQL